MAEHFFEYGVKETDWLKSRDPVLGAAIEEIGPIKRAVIPDLFAALASSIAGQQISTKAHITIWNRMQERFSPFTPAVLGAAPVETVQSCGISMRKAQYIKGIADSVLNGSLDLASLQNMTDDEVCSTLVQIKGVGVWTAEMLLIFSLQRPDVLSQNDLAIIRGLRVLYHQNEITPKLFDRYRKRYSPYATTASLYLWAVAGREKG